MDGRQKFLKNPISRFLDWFDKHTTENLLLIAFITYLQIPHFVWAGDAILKTGFVFGANPILDFFLYGIDLIEVIPMVSLTLLVIAKIKNRNH
jgi:hypothetical protein